MAKAKVYQMVQECQVVQEIQLTLSADEARALRDVLYCVGGHDRRTRRRFTQAVYEALLEAVGFATPKQVLDITGSTVFAIEPVAVITEG